MVWSVGASANFLAANIKTLFRPNGSILKQCVRMNSLQLLYFGNYVVFSKSQFSIY